MAATVESPVMQSMATGWQNFVEGSKVAGSWCLTKLSEGAGLAWEGMKKVAEWAADYFPRLGSAIATFAVENARELTIIGATTAVILTVTLLCTRYLGCCNKPNDSLELNKPVTG